MEEVIEQVIRAYFPDELADPEAFADWCEPLRQKANPEAANLLSKLETSLDSIKSDCQDADRSGRDFWELFGGAERLVKSAASIRSKLARDLHAEQSDGKSDATKQTVEQLADRVYGFSDLGRIRIVADFPSDVSCLQKKLFEEKKFLGVYLCPNGIKDFVFDPKLRNGLKGHRARQFSARVRIDSSTGFGFEVQLMTRLQHAWDRRNHPLYEWQREHPDWQKIPNAVQLAVDDFACAEALHLVDRQADMNWQRLKEEFIERRRS
ncbi:MAG: hypothetical protein LLG97_18560 [Deltaproteobacteria bacterium]|nr:hypothetical protein [Deltaproteobacteria bacterium]